MDKNCFYYVLHLADNSLIMGHRLSEWTGHGPMLEQDIALSNIALDLIGQSRNFYQYAAEIFNSFTKEEKLIAIAFRENIDEVTEDTLAYFRDAHQFKNFLITELPNGDWAKTILKLFFFSTYQFYLYEKLQLVTDKQLAAIAEKSLKEVTYHVRWSSQWVIRLGDGTDESKSRVNTAIEELWPFTREMFEIADFENNCNINLPVDAFEEIKNLWQDKVKEIFVDGTLSYPDDKNNWMQKGGKEGIHTEHLGYILAEMQFLQRAYPGCEW